DRAAGQSKVRTQNQSGTADNRSIILSQERIAGHVHLHHRQAVERHLDDSLLVDASQLSGLSEILLLGLHQRFPTDTGPLPVRSCSATSRNSRSPYSFSSVSP